MKKIISLLLAAVLLVSGSLSVAAAGAQQENPIVIIRGMDFGGLIIDQGTENERAALSVDVAPLILDVVKGLFSCIFTGMDGLADLAVDIVGGIFFPLACDENGDTIENISVREFPLAMSNYPETIEEFSIHTDGEGAAVYSAIERYGAENVYYVTYDWRLDPYETADKINDRVNLALSESGAEKVRIICCSLGGVMSQAYFDKYGYDKVESCVFLSSAIYGSYCSSDPYTGKVSIDKNILMTYLSDTLPDLDFLWTFLDSIGLAGLITNFANDFMDEYKAVIYEKVMRTTFATWPGLWGMQQTDDYEAAKEIMFGDETEKYAGVIEKTDRYQQYRLQRDDFLKQMNEDGVSIIIITSYGAPPIPAFDHSYVQSDSVLETELMSAGATVAPYGKTFEDDYVAADPSKLSPDRIVDASTCLFPDYTWFIAGAPHVCCMKDSDVCDMIFRLSEFDGQPTVHSYGRYPQFQYCDTTQKLYHFI